jgi:hypothetical protein
MKVSWKRIVGCAIAAAFAFGMMLPELQGQSFSKGSFKLPFDAKMGKIALPSGDYEYTIGRGSIDGTLLVYHGSQQVGMLRPEMLDRYDSEFEKTVLVFVRHDGDTVLRALKMPDVGTFYFSLPKKMKTLMAKQPQQVETISVDVSGY